MERWPDRKRATMNNGSSKWKWLAIGASILAVVGTAWGVMANVAAKKIACKLGQTAGRVTDKFGREWEWEAAKSGEGDSYDIWISEPGRPEGAERVVRVATVDDACAAAIEYVGRL